MSIINPWYGSHVEAIGEPLQKKEKRNEKLPFIMSQNIDQREERTEDRRVM